MLKSRRTKQQIPDQLWCPICLEWDPSSSFRVLQCGHCFCGDCIDEWQEQKLRTCPSCRKEDKRSSVLLEDPKSFTNHVFLPDPPEQEIAMEMGKLLSAQLKRRNQTIRYLRDTAIAISELELTGAGFKVGGSAAGLVGAVMAIVGTALSLSGVGAVAGLPVAITGATIGGIGGVNVAGAIIAESVIKNSKLEGVNEHLQSDYFHSMQLRILIGRAARNAGFARRFDLPPQDAFSLIGMLGRVAKFGTSVGALARGIALGVSRGAATAGLHIAGMIIAAALIPIDIAQMVKSSIKIHKKSPSQIVLDLQEQAALMEEELWALLHENGYDLFENCYFDEEGSRHWVIFAVNQSQDRTLLHNLFTMEELHVLHIVLVDSYKQKIANDMLEKIYKIWPHKSVRQLSCQVEGIDLY